MFLCVGCVGLSYDRSHDVSFHHIWDTEGFCLGFDLFGEACCFGLLYFVSDWIRLCFVGLGRIRPLLVGLIQFDLRCVGMSCSASFWVGLGGFEFV